MSKDLDVLLDKCIDRMNEGESLEECLANYPAHAEALEPLLRAMWDVRDACSTMPRATAKSVVGRRLDAALVNSDRGLRKPQRRTMPLFGWSRVWATAAIVLVLTVIGFGLTWMLAPGVTPVVAQDNFRLLVSDQENAIGDFESLEVTITSIGMLRGGEGGGWEVIELEPSVVTDLTPLQGLNAQEIWGGIIPEGQYTQVFIYINDAKGTLKNGEIVNVIIPSGNLQISKPFTIAADDPVVSFVYDVAVVAAGDEYVLMPQVDQSGANQPYHEFEGALSLWVVDPESPTPVTPGEEITVSVTLHGDPMHPVPGVQVEVNGEHYGNTNEVGEVTFDVPIAEELKIKAKVYTAQGELEGKLRIDFGDELTLDVEGTVTPDHEITVQVTFVTLQGVTIPIQGALVEVNDEDIGETDVNGLISFVVPYDDELEIKAKKGELKGKLEIDLERELTLQVVEGEVTPGESITILVTFQGDTVEGALVEVNDDEVGTTAEDGRISFTVPYDDKLKIKAVKGELKGELKYELGDELTPEIDHEVGESKLTLEVVEGEAIPGESITVLVTFQGDPVEGALVEVNDEEVGETDGDGLISFDVPSKEELDEDALEIEAEKGELKGELEIELRDELTPEIDHEVGESKLTLEVVEGEAIPGESITVLVTFQGDPVEGALVEVNDEEVGETDGDGLVSFDVPSEEELDEDELEIEAEKGELKGELEIELEQD